jgi:predicted amidohydrolase
MTPTTGAWKLIPGRRIYRFIHPQWGDFTVAICSDIIDPVPWASLKGQILHLFLCSYNPDVNLFESMTWVRADENCVNLVATNCGHYGGSFAWSPRSAENRELARVRGNHVFVLADVSLPVKELLNWQKTGVSKSVAKELEKTWRDNEYPDAKFKAPPPQFPGRPG